MLLIEPGRANQNRSKNERDGMKVQKAVHRLGFTGVVDDVVSGHPELAQPDIEKKNRKKASQIENVLFEWDWPAECGCGDSQGGADVLIIEEPLCENKIEQASERYENGQRPPEGALRNVQPLTRQEPSGDECDGNDEQQKANGIAMRCRALVERNGRSSDSN